MQQSSGELIRATEIISYVSKQCCKNCVPYQRSHPSVRLPIRQSGQRKKLPPTVDANDI